MSRLGAFLIKGLASGFYLSYLPARFTRIKTWTGAGLVGTLLGVLSARWLPADPLKTTAVLLGGLFIAVAVGDAAEELLDTHDDPRIVIDEWIGVLFATAWMPRSAATLALAFVLFRLFDVWKPGWVRNAGHLPGGWGVVMDDVLAGLLANGAIQLVRLLNVLP